MLSFPKQIDFGDFSLQKIEPTAENAEQLLHTVDNNRDFLSPFLEWVDAFTTTDRAMKNITKAYAADACSYFIVVDGKIAGKISFVDNDGVTDEISYWLAREYTGRGIMTRALREMVKMGFEIMNRHRVQLTIDIDNTASIATAARAGFICEGTLHKYFILRDVARDMKMYAVWQ